MCVLCGDLMTQAHWTDLARHSDDDGVVDVGGQRQRDYARTRWQRIQVMNDILRFYALSVADWNGSRYLVADKKGRVLLGINLQEAWGHADALAGRRIDPLNPALLQYLQEKHTPREEGAPST